jgi:predicted HTH domain antitoxin
MGVTFDIPETVMTSLQERGGDVEECLRLELGCALYQRGMVSFGSAAEVAGLHPFAFGHELTRRGIPRVYRSAEMAEDAAYVAGRQ